MASLDLSAEFDMVNINLLLVSDSHTHHCITYHLPPSSQQPVPHQFSYQLPVSTF